MSRFTRRVLAVTAVTAVAGSLSLLVLMSSARTSAAPAPTPQQNVITIPGPDQISNTLDTSRCPRLKTYINEPIGGISSVQGADGHLAVPSVASEHALMLPGPLTAAECAAAGN